MKTKSLLVIFALIPLFATAQTLHQPNKKKPLNLSMNVDQRSKPDSLSTVFFNLGFITNIHRLHGVGINALSSTIRTDMCGMQLSGLANIAGHKATGLQLSGLANINGGNSSGIIATGLVNITGHDNTGLHLSGLTNVTGGNSNGLAASGLINLAGKEMNGAQLSAIANVVGEDTRGISVTGLLNVNARDVEGGQVSGLMNICGDEVKGVQLSGVSNVGVDVAGVQVSGLSNIAASQMTGLQLSGVTNIAMKLNGGFQLAPANIALSEMKGVQLGTGNYATEVRGVQLGVLNICAGEVRGVQIGLINHSKDTSTVKIGLVNVNPSTRIRLMAYGGNTTKTNIAVRFQNKLFYSILGVGTHYLDLNDKFSGATFYRVGMHRQIVNKLDLSGDLGYYHIENFENESATVPERMYSLQARVNLEYQPIRKLGIFASGGYGVTRYYDRNKLFEKKPIVELGIVLF